MTFSENFPEVALPTQVTHLCPAEYLQDLIVLNLLLKLTFIVSVPMVMRSEDVQQLAHFGLSSGGHEKGLTRTLYLRGFLRKHQIGSWFCCAQLGERQVPPRRKSPLRPPGAQFHQGTLGGGTEHEPEEWTTGSKRSCHVDPQLSAQSLRPACLTGKPMLGGQALSQTADK